VACSLQFLSVMPRILVVDDDLCTRATLVSELSRPQREIVFAGDGEEALASACTLRPHLVITDIVMPRLDGWELVEALRGRRETAHSAVIMLTEFDSTAARIRALRLGAIDFLNKPVDPEELELRVENALHYRVHTLSPIDWAPANGVAGSLGHVSVASMLNMLSLDRQSGELRIANGGAAATLLLRDGAVVSAFFAAPRRPRGAACVYEVLRWRAGRFAFTHHPVPGPDEVHMPTAALVIEGALVADRRTQHTRRAG
jgi:DNA-binding response OmpR family regulator